jgi:small-conductance mechanosensitive channel
MLIPATRFGIWFGAALAVLSIVSPSSNTLLALLASLGIAIGLGAQDLIKNLIGGLVILADRPYQIGDRVQIGDASGEIDHIGLRSTKLTTFDDTRVTIPNSEILTGKAWNSNSGVPDEQVNTDLYLPLNVDPILVEQLAYEVAISSPYVRISRPILVLLQDRLSAQPYLMVRIKAYVYDHRYELHLQNDLTVRAKSAFRAHGIYQQPAVVSDAK